MSRIHEALQKARNQQPGSASNLPDTEEIIVTGTSWTPPAQQADPTSEMEPLELLRQSAAEPSPVPIQCAANKWNPDPEQMLFLSKRTDALGQEQFRTLRSRLYQIRGSGQLSVIAVTSAIPDEGKSFVSANLAHAFAAQSSCRALLIDADLRRFDGSTAMLDAPRVPGLTEYLLGEQPLSSVLQSGGIENLYLISCGKRVERPGELISDPKLGLLIAQLRPMFDWIVIDNPPVLPIADAHVVSDLSDGTLLVVDAQSTQAHLVKRAVKEFDRKRILGVVLNMTKDVSTRYYSDYGYGYHQVEHQTALE